MKYLLRVLTFGWPFVRKYWTRLVFGVVLGLLFGVTNASFVWATKTMVTRLTPPQEAAAPSAVPDLPAPKLELGGKFKELGDRLEAFGKGLEERVNGWVDPWLPRFGNTPTLRQTLGGLLLLPLMVALRGFSGYFSSYFLAWVSTRAINDLRLAVLAKLQTLSIDYFHKSTMGDLITRINGDTAALYRALSLGVSDLIKEPITIVVVFAILILNDWKLTLISFVFLPVCIIPLVILGRKSFAASKGNLTVAIDQTSLMFEMLSNMRIVKAFGLEKPQRERFRHLCHLLVHHDMKGVKARELVNPVTETIAMLGLGVLVLYIFYYQVQVPDLLAFLTGVIMIFSPAKKLGRLHVLYKTTAVGIDRLMSLFEQEPSVKERTDPKPCPDFKEALNFENVSFAYLEQPVLKNVNFRIPRGMKLGIAGESGSGKSTLVNLVLRFYDPREGAIRIDGEDFRDLALDDLRQHMALVSQENVIFDQTVAENIAGGKPTATRAEIEAAARSAYAHDFISELPQGYDTRVGERGESLSVGQRQRLAIARAFVRDAPILVLDEATASLDSQAEAVVQKAIEQLEKNRTVICIAHRLSTLREMDHIIVLARGEIVEQGTFDQLLQSDGPFASMAAKQGIRPGDARR